METDSDNRINVLAMARVSWAIIAFFTLLLGTQADDWPQFFGPTFNRISRESGLLKSFGTNGPPLVWEKQVGTGYSAPSVTGDYLVLHHRLKGEEIVECFSTKTSQSIWRHSNPSTYVDPYGYNNGPRCTPLLTGTRCYTFGTQGRLLCLNLKDGSLVWERETAKDWTIPEAFFGVGSSPILEGNTLIVMVGGQPNSGVVGFDAATGKTLWESVGAKNWQGQPMVAWPGERKVDWQDWEKQASYSTPVAATVNGVRQIFCLMRQGLVSLNPTNGMVNFSFWFRSRANDTVNAMNPIVIGDTVFISGAYYKVGSVLLKVKPDNKGVEEVWRGLGMELHWDTPVLRDGFLYGFSGRNEPDSLFRCVEYKSGKVMWERDERWAGHAPMAPTYGRGSAIYADGQLIALGEGGILGLFDVNSEKAVERSRAQIARLKYPCWTAPILAGKKLYLRSEGWLLCFDMAQK